MMDIRHSQATKANPLVERATGAAPPANAAWIAQRAKPGSVVLVGGASLIAFRVRVAQSRLRRDLFPSFWSMTGIVEGTRSFLTVPLSRWDASLVPRDNGVHRLRLSEIDDAGRYPNVAVIQFADPGKAILANVRRLTEQRSVVDLPSLLVPWLGYVWGREPQQNPLTVGIGLPSAVLVQTAFAMSGVELTPGLTTSSGCPEAIWQSALWWHGYYEKTAGVSGEPIATAEKGTKSSPVTTLVPSGEYLVRQSAAAVTYRGDVR